MSFLNKATVQINERQTLVGIDKYLKEGTAISILGASYLPTQLKAVIQADLDAAAVTQTAHAAWQLAVEEERTAHATAHGVLLGLKGYLVAQYGKKVDVLTDFGFTTPKAPKTTPATKVAAAAKAKATRKARGTLGKKQRLAITGAPDPATATGSTTAPATGAAPAPAPVPATGAAPAK
jgi:hypothetical protein